MSGSDSKYHDQWCLNCDPKNSAYMFHMQDTQQSSLIFFWGENADA